MSNGNFYSLPIPDRANGSGKFKEIAKKINENIKQSPLYRLADRPMGARQHSEEVMRDSIDKMSDIFGVKAEYVYDAKDTNKKGWYDPKDGKVYVNLSAHETIADAKALSLLEWPVLQDWKLLLFSRCKKNVKLSQHTNTLISYMLLHYSKLFFCSSVIITPQQNLSNYSL